MGVAAHFQMDWWNVFHALSNQYRSMWEFVMAFEALRRKSVSLSRVCTG